VFGEASEEVSFEAVLMWGAKLQSRLNLTKVTANPQDDFLKLKTKKKSGNWQEVMIIPVENTKFGRLSGGVKFGGLITQTKHLRHSGSVFVISSFSLELVSDQTDLALGDKVFVFPKQLILDKENPYQKVLCRFPEGYHPG
jgi:hypothetical protein